MTVSREDVLAWIEMADSDGDGRVTMEDYEELVLRSLQKQGLQIEGEAVVIWFK